MKDVMCNIYNTRNELIFLADNDDGSKPSSEEIIKCLTKEEFVGKFNNDDYEYSDKIKIGKDDDTYITKDNDGVINVWKVFTEGVWDVNGNIIPGLYYVRKIGIIVKVRGESIRYEE
jgi:hypothetical protein